MTEPATPPPNGDPAAADHRAEPLRPAEFAHLALASVDASEGRRRRRRRDTLADSLGLDLKLELLQAIAAADPEPADLQAFLLDYALAPGRPSGPIRGVCSDVWTEWESARLVPGFADWLRGGALDRGEDARSPGRGGPRESYRPDPATSPPGADDRPPRRERFEWELRGAPREE